MLVARNQSLLSLVLQASRRTRLRGETSTCVASSSMFRLTPTLSDRRQGVGQYRGLPDVGSVKAL